MKKSKILAVVAVFVMALAIAPVSVMATPVGDGVTSTATSSRSDSTLKELGISPGTITPIFSPSRLEYQATLPSGTTAIKVFATPNSPDGGIAYVTGSKTLVDGTNTVKVCCGAADGTSTVYIITVYVGTTAPAPEATTGVGDTVGGADTTTGVDTAIGTDTNTTTQQIDPLTGLPVDTSIVSDSAMNATPVVEENTPHTDADGHELVEVYLDEDGNIVYEEATYVKDGLPEGDYVSAKKYKKAQKQAKELRQQRTTFFIITAVIGIIFVIFIINLFLRIKDKNDELETFYSKEEYKNDFKLSAQAEKKPSKKEQKEIEKAKKAKEEAELKEAKRKLLEKAAAEPDPVDDSDDDIEFIDLD